MCAVFVCVSFVCSIDRCLLQIASALPKKWWGPLNDSAHRGRRWQGQPSIRTWVTAASIFLCLACNGWRFRVFDFHPMRLQQSRDLYLRVIGARTTYLIV